MLAHGKKPRTFLSIFILLVSSFFSSCHRRIVFPLPPLCLNSIYLCTTTAVEKMSVCMYVARLLLFLPLSLPASFLGVGGGKEQAR